MPQKILRFAQNDMCGTSCFSYYRRVYARRRDKPVATDKPVAMPHYTSDRKDLPLLRGLFSVILYQVSTCVPLWVRVDSSALRSCPNQ